MKNIARITGIGYLIIFFTGFYANFFVLESLVDQNSAQDTFSNFLVNHSQLNWGVLSFTIMVLVDIILAWPLYILLKPTNRNISLLSSGLRLINGGIFAIALFSLFNILTLINNAGSELSGHTGTQPEEAMLLLERFDTTWLIGLVFFGLHLLLLGYLVFRSFHFPKLIGLLLILAGAGYVLDSFAQFYYHSYEQHKDIFEMAVVIPGILGEFSLTLWLLIKGVRQNNQDSQVN